MPLPVPRGFQLAGIHCGIKSDPNKEDLTLVYSDRPAVAAGVYTQNVVVAAPVILNRQRTPSDHMRLVVINSGNANACTGERGLADSRQMAARAATACGLDEDKVLVLSTGIIGEYLPMGKLNSGIDAAAGQLAANDGALSAAARGMMTTDTIPKLAGRDLTTDERAISVTGLAKGSGMIGPQMATMLAVIMTDAPIAAPDAQQILSAAVAETFNCISVDGHTSTNDTVLMLGNGSAGGAVLEGELLEQFTKTVVEVCRDLARAIAGDGEGASHLVTIRLRGCETRDDARQIAKTVANSLLVKTAIAGADPNWGRIVSAAGYSGVTFDPDRLDLYMNDTLIYSQGAPTDFDAAQLSASIRTNRETNIILQFHEGSEGICFWTSDLTTDYVKLNADYHT